MQDATRASEGFSASWWSHLWRVKVTPLVDSQEYKDIIDNEAEIFNLNTNIALNQQASEINKVEVFISTDKTIIELRKRILKTSESQLNNGVITSSAYIIELTNLYEAENNLNTHKIQLLLSKANYNITQGN